MKRILILGAGEMQVPIIKKAKELGLFCIVADYDSSAPGFLYADKISLTSTNDLEGLLELSIQEKITAILTTSDYPVKIVAKISSLLGLNSMSEEVADICTDKYKQRQICKENNINVPYFKLCEKIDDLNEITNFPYIVKPVDSSASRGVKKVHNRADLVEAYYIAEKYSKNKKVIVEKFIEGREFSVETLTQNFETTIIAITEKLVIGEEKGYFVEDTHIQPARISEKEKCLIENEVKKAIKVIGLNNSPSHTEIKLNPQGAYIIEIACRLGGDYITSDLVPLSTGIDMLANLIKISLGKNIEVKPLFNKYACVQFFNGDNYNRCVDFINSEDNRIIRSEIKNYEHKEIKNSLDRMGYVICQAATLEELESILKIIK